MLIQLQDVKWVKKGIGNVFVQSFQSAEAGKGVPGNIDDDVVRQQQIVQMCQMLEIEVL